MPPRGTTAPPETLPTPSHSSPRWTIWTTRGQPCDENGYDLPEGTPPPPKEPRAPNNYWPFVDEEEFHFADFLFMHEQMSAGNTDILMSLIVAFQMSRYGNADPPFSTSKHMWDTIDSIPLGDVPWEGFKVSYDGDVPDPAPSWMKREYKVWFRNPLHIMEAQIGNPDFAQEIDIAPKRVLGQNKKRQFTDLMSADWAWEQDQIAAEDPDTHGAMFVPVILGSDKTTVSVSTGQNEYYPLYAALGNTQNHVRHAHRDALTVIGFLAILKTERDQQDTAQFHKFRQQLFHASLTKILSLLKPWMTKPRVTCCSNGYYWRVIYGLGPYIADYPEQCLLASLKEAFEGKSKELWEGYGIIDDILPFTSYFPQGNIHELLSPDLLHQLIKGTFKDHLVTWVVQWMEMQPNGKWLVTEMDQRIAAAPIFSGLHRFPEGHGFKQWTGNDSKALMKVFLPAINGLVPPAMVHAVQAFLEFCYLVCCSQIDEMRESFHEHGIHEDFLLPCQHSVSHYWQLIQMFGAPNGLCSSITESKHIKAVKEPWCHSNCNEPLGQMLLTNQRLDKLAAFQVELESCVQENSEDVDQEEVEGQTSEGDVCLPRRPASGYPRTLVQLSHFLDIPDFEQHIRRFLYDQLHPDSEVCGMDVDIEECPRISPTMHLKVFHLATAVYHVPSDLSGIGGMHREYIRMTQAWHGGPACYDCIFVEREAEEEGFHALGVAQHNNVTYACAFVKWFETHGDSPCPDTGLWRVKPDFMAHGRRMCSVIHIDSILCTAHLIGVYGDKFIPSHLHYHHSLDAFKLFYVNKFADHHAHEIAY
ncbi:hypothetical protein CPB84DRAFT_1816350 [Gymnopilus junonius]|uniref:Uncharacterized protein n=1 Tax=Gymnopilus junonius TaxID=109634 RepID=A0A9P5NKD4_GYMJU|nr:hypothetical protein CPB84DRAFT_1816350 [Gymnopilus junonius]